MVVDCGVTRWGWPTCDVTCNNNPPTCYGTTCDLACQPTFQPTACLSSTCGSTCGPAQCPTALFGVTVPQVGQIQMSFSSSASLQYTLQYCTNLAANEWLNATNAQGNGGVITFSHTNNARLLFYRLLITQ